MTVLHGLVLIGVVVGGRAARAQVPIGIARFDHPPLLDGTLTDPVWRTATQFVAFKTLHPDAGKEPSESTQVFLGYDHSSIYVGVRSVDRAPDSVQSVAHNPDDAWRGDWVAFCLDSHNDALDAYYFLVTPSGYKVAGVLGFDGGPRQSLDRVWRSAVKRSAKGYTVEMAIPLARLAYVGADSVRMAFKVARAIGRRGEEMDFPAIDPERAHLAQLQRIVLTGVEPSQERADRPLFDSWSVYRDKVAKFARVAGGDSTMEGRVEAWGDASVFDARIFRSRPLAPSPAPYHLARRLAHAAVAGRFARLEYAPGRVAGDLDRFLTRTQSTAFIVIHNDTIIEERYFNGWGPESLFTSFSTAKAFVATLVGIAIDRGLIHSVADSITRYLPELAKRDPRFDRITIRDLLRMASGLRYIEDEGPYDDRWTYLPPDLRRAALERSTIVQEPGTRWHYNNYNALLLGMILERVSGRTVTDLLQDWIWTPLGMEYGGSWSIDSRAHGFEKMESGINARPVDFGKLGELYLHEGRWNGRQVLSPGWIRDATQPWTAPAGYYEDRDFFGPGRHYFGYFWWGDSRTSGASDFHTVGNKGQFIYCSPQKHLVVVRTGMQFGIPSSTWLNVFRGFADQY